jgi:hypothetical protein
MPITKQRTLAYLEHEWGTYVERFHRLPPEEQLKRVKQMGYERFRDMLAHILAWWEEGMETVLAIAEERPFERKKYDFDVFNAEAVAKYKDWDEAAFMQRFETMRQKTVADLRSMNEAVFENRRVRSWIHGIFIHHAREHLVALSRFLTLDLLENEWAEYIENFQRLEEDKQKEFLARQALGSFHDVAAHVTGWWEEGARIISGILETPGFTWVDPDTDAFNVELTKKYARWSDEDLFRHYDNVRRELIVLVADLPDDAFLNKDIEGWLAADVVSHYDDHPLPA